MDNTHFSLKITIFHGVQMPEEGTIAGYGALIEGLKLEMPFPEQLALISEKRRSYTTAKWKVFSSKNTFEDTLYKHLVFALKYEGVNLLFFKKFAEKRPEIEIVKILQLEPTGQYSRKIWFLYEWLMQKQLNIEDLTIKNFVPLLDENLQFAVKGIRSTRHRIINNLPGTRDFCPLIAKKEKLEAYLEANLSEKKNSF